MDDIQTLYAKQVCFTEQLQSDIHCNSFICLQFSSQTVQCMRVTADSLVKYLRTYLISVSFKQVPRFC